MTGIDIESTVVHGNTAAQARGQYFALIVALAVMAFAFFLVSLGHLGWAIGTVLGEMIALAGIFIYGREKQASERKDKMGQLVGGKK